MSFVNSSREDYIQAIYRLSKENGYATNKGISEYLKISKPSVTEMIKKLVAEELLVIEKNRIILSANGTEQAQYILSKHRLWEYFLSEVLHLKEDLLHAQADLLEHSTSDELFDALNKYLDYPLTSPKGKTIYTNHNDE